MQVEVYALGVAVSDADDEFVEFGCALHGESIGVSAPLALHTGEARTFHALGGGHSRKLSS